MIKLSDRLQKIADWIEVGESVADVGTDHGFLPIYLRETGKSPQVILCDINSGPLEKAKENIRKRSIGESFDMRLGSGLEPLSCGEVDVIAIAGMGGALVIEILVNDFEKTKTFSKYIFQPRNGQAKLRKWLLQNGFRIVDEALIREGKYICELIMAIPSNNQIELPVEEFNYEFSPILFEKKDPLLVEFIENKIRIERKVFESIEAGANQKKNEMLAQTENRMKQLEKLRRGVNQMSMKMSDLIAEIEVIAPRDLEEDWDNCGMQINMGNTEVKRVLVALEITKGVIAEAMSKNVDFIVTHHPLLFKKIDVVDNNDIKGNYMIDLIKRGISVYAAHTTFDEAFGGNNEYLADMIGLSRVRKMKNKRAVIKGEEPKMVSGRMGNFETPMKMSDVCTLIEDALGVKGQMKTSGDMDKMIKTVGLCAGSGIDSMMAAIKNDCDLFLTGDIRHHEAQTAKESGLCVIDAGHYGTERIFTENFAGKLKKAVGTKIEVLESEINSNPFNLVV